MRERHDLDLDDRDPVPVRARVDRARERRGAHVLEHGLARLGPVEADARELAAHGRDGGPDRVRELPVLRANDLADALQLIGDEPLAGTDDDERQDRPRRPRLPERIRQRRVGAQERPDERPPLRRGSPVGLDRQADPGVVRDRARTDGDATRVGQAQARAYA